MCARARFGGEREETRCGAKRFPRCGRWRAARRKHFCHQTREEQTGDSRFGPGGKICSRQPPLFGCFLSPDRRSQRRDRDTPRHGPAFRFRPWLERSRFTVASRPPHPPSSPRRCVRRGVPPSRPTRPRKRELRPAAGPSSMAASSKGPARATTSPRLTAIPHRTRRPLSPPTRSSKPVAAAGHLASRRGPLRRARADRLRRAVRRPQRIRRRILLLRPRPLRRRGFRAEGCRERLGHRGERG